MTIEHLRICGACNENIPNHWVIGLDKFWHQDCFCCGVCGRVVDAKETFYEKDGESSLLVLPSFL